MSVAVFDRISALPDGAPSLREVVEPGVVQRIATARARKAMRLVAECRAHGIGVGTAERLDVAGRHAVAGLAGTRPPSAETWAIVVQLLADSEPEPDPAALRQRLSGLLRLWRWDADDAAHAADTLCLGQLRGAEDDEREQDRRMASRLSGEATTLVRAIGEIRSALGPDVGDGRVPEAVARP